MCGGLVASTCSEKGDIFRYQLGRGLGYLVMGALAGGFGYLLDLKSLPLGVRLIPPFFLGGLFIYWGVQNLRMKRVPMRLPKFFSRTYSKLWGRYVSGRDLRERSFFIGLFSIFLPCGMLYGVVISTLAFQSPWMGMMAMFAFWLGTLPAMVIAPSIIRKILAPLRLRLPKLYSSALIIIGILTISFRVNTELKAQSTKSPPDNCHTSQRK